MIHAKFIWNWEECENLIINAHLVLLSGVLIIQLLVLIQFILKKTYVLPNSDFSLPGSIL